MKKTFCTAIVLAAGSGKRMGTRIAKQYLEIDGKPLLYYTLLAFERSPRIDKIILTVGSEEQISYCQETINRPAKRGQPLGRQDGKTANPDCRMENGLSGSLS